MMRLSVWASSSLPTLFHRRTVSARLPTVSSLPRRPFSSSILLTETDLPPRNDAYSDAYLTEMTKDDF